MSEEQRSAQRYLEDLTPGGSEYANNPKRCYEWAIGRIESAHRIAMEAALERNALRARVSELEAEQERIKAELDDHRVYSSEMLQAAWIYRVAFEGYRTPGDGERLAAARKRLFDSINPKQPSQAEQIAALASEAGAREAAGDDR